MSRDEQLRRRERAILDDDLGAPVEAPAAASNHRVPRFPLDALPAPCARLARELAAAVPCPLDFAAVPLLAVAATAIGTSRTMELKPGHREAARLNLATCGRPGSGKSPGFRTALKPAWAWQARARDAYLAECEEWEHAATAAKSADEEEPPAPVMTRLVVDDLTIEALAPLLERNPRGLLVAADELAGWVRSIGAYKSGRGADRQRWLTLWTGSPLVVDRKGAPEPIMVSHPFVCVTGGLQPDTLAVLVAEGGADDGFSDRVLVSYPDPVPLALSDSGVSPTAEASWSAIFERLRELRPADDAPAVLTLDAEAATDWRTWRGALLEERNDAPDHLKGPLAKLDAHAARLVVVAHELRHAAGEGGLPLLVDIESLRRGLALADYFKGHFERVYVHVSDAWAELGRRRSARGPTPERRAEIGERALRELAREQPLFLAELARRVGVDEKNRTLRTALDELAGAGHVVKEEGSYRRAALEARHYSTPPTPPTKSEVSHGVGGVEFSGAPSTEDLDHSNTAGRANPVGTAAGANTPESSSEPEAPDPATCSCGRWSCTSCRPSIPASNGRSS